MFMCFVLCSVVLCSVCCCVNVEAVLQLRKVCVEGCVKHVERCMLFDAAVRIFLKQRANPYGRES